ncbi:hypothetical protein GGX14DRAFT_607132 [Mycena pura]|uniref:Uncharacterized protein n=1 Tax=Mycena pura TaxID=153505 RepID=A0AAD6VKX4_9AGAR|nr:hypothetical protein GGX14DRAFT_607132 [Mycena pura]
MTSPETVSPLLTAFTISWVISALNSIFVSLDAVRSNTMHLHKRGPERECYAVSIRWDDLGTTGNPEELPGTSLTPPNAVGRVWEEVSATGGEAHASDGMPMPAINAHANMISNSAMRGMPVCHAPPKWPTKGSQIIFKIGRSSGNILCLVIDGYYLRPRWAEYTLAINGKPRKWGLGMNECSATQKKPTMGQIKIQATQ